MKITGGKIILIIALAVGLLSMSNPLFAATQVTTNTNTAATPSPQNTGMAPEAFFGLLAQRMAAYLHNVSTAVNKTEGLSDEQKQTLVQALSGNISYIQRQALIINKAQKTDDLQKRIVELRDYWIQQSNAVKYAVAHIQAGRVNNAIQQLKQLDEKMTTLISRLKASGSTTEDLETLHQEFTKEMAAAQEQYTKALSEFQKLKDANTNVTAYKAGKDFLNQAHLHLQKAHTIFLHVLQNVKGRIPQSSSTINNANQ